MLLFTVIVTVGLVYAACVGDLKLLWFVGVAVLAQFVYNIFWQNEPQQSHQEDQARQVIKTFFSDMKFSPWSKLFDCDVVREKLQTMNEVMIKELYHDIREELEIEDNETYCKNMQWVLIYIKQEITNRQIEVYRHSKREKNGNYARLYAQSLGFAECTTKNLSDTDVLYNVGDYSTAELVHVVLDVPTEIRDTTAELTTGREEEMERYYHNNLRKVEQILRQELATRFLDAA